MTNEPLMPDPSDTPGQIARRRADLYAEVWGHRKRKPTTEPTDTDTHDKPTGD